MISPTELSPRDVDIIVDRAASDHGTPDLLPAARLRVDGENEMSAEIRNDSPRPLRRRETLLLHPKMFHPRHEACRRRYQSRAPTPAAALIQPNHIRVRCYPVALCSPPSRSSKASVSMRGVKGFCSVATRAPCGRPRVPSDTGYPLVASTAIAGSRSRTL